VLLLLEALINKEEITTKTGTMCGVGAAYRAGLSGVVILQVDSITDAHEAQALMYKYQINDIYRFVGNVLLTNVASLS